MCNNRHRDGCTVRNTVWSTDTRGTCSSSPQPASTVAQGPRHAGLHKTCASVPATRIRIRGMDDIGWRTKRPSPIQFVRLLSCMGRGSRRRGCCRDSCRCPLSNPAQPAVGCSGFYGGAARTRSEYCRPPTLQLPSAEAEGRGSGRGVDTHIPYIAQGI